jgi:hypothetical protein
VTWQVSFEGADGVSDEKGANKSPPKFNYDEQIRYKTIFNLTPFIYH